MTFSEQIKKAPTRNGFVTMFHPTRKANGDQMLIQSVRADAVPVYQQEGWQEYTEPSEPFEARRAGSNDVRISMDELKRLRALADKVESETKPANKPEEIGEPEEEEVQEEIEVKKAPEPAKFEASKKGRGNWKK